VGEQKVRSIVEIEVPSSKSWEQVTWTVEERSAQVAGLSAERTCKLQGEPVLIDFGAGSSVYTTLKATELASFQSFGIDGPGVSWKISTETAGELCPLAVMPRSMPSRPEGWAHVMDRQQATAVALAEFDRPGRDARIVVDGAGHLTIGRDLGRNPPQPASRKSLKPWPHFVSMPVPIGALTSPQSMMTPPIVEVRPPRGRRGPEIVCRLRWPTGSRCPTSDAGTPVAGRGA
jgi:hypothetical protein